MRGAIPPLTNMHSWRGAQLRNSFLQNVTRGLRIRRVLWSDLSDGNGNTDRP
jgi:hypothetical protein